MDLLSTVVEKHRFGRVRRGGYDPRDVDAFMVKVGAAALEMEETITAAHAKVHGLERWISEAKGAEDAVEAAFLAAADAKHHLIEGAGKRANEIIENARREAENLAEPLRRLQHKEQELEGAWEDVERARAAADEEAERLLAAARRQADRIVAEARHDALLAIEESKREAEEWLEQARTEHQRMTLMLRGLRAAVRDMLDDGMRRNEVLRVALDDETEHPGAKIHLAE